MSTASVRDQPRPHPGGKQLAAPKLGSGVVDPVPAEPLDWLDDQDWLDELLDEAGD